MQPTLTSNSPVGLPSLMTVLLLASAIFGPTIFGEQAESPSPSDNIAPDSIQLTFFEVSSYTVWPEGTSPAQELNAGLPHLKQVATAAPLLVLSEKDFDSYSLCPLHLEFVLSDGASDRLLEAIEAPGIEPVRDRSWAPWLLGKGFLLTLAGHGILGGEGSFRGTPRIYRFPVIIPKFDSATIALQIQPWGNYALLEDPQTSDLGKAWKLDRAGIRQDLDQAAVPSKPCGETWQ